MAKNPSGERLQKVLAAAGFGSRRHCEELILTGRVTVDRQAVTTLGTRVDPAQEKIFVDGVPVKIERKRYFLLCKPIHVVCTAFDPAGRTKAIDLVPRDFGRLFTVGRLDENSEGLLLVTNDGELANRLAHPRFQVERRYRVLVAGQPTAKTLNDLEHGFHFAEGKFRLRDVRRVATKGQSAVLDVALTEGQNREIRRLFARVGHKVMALMRIGFGPLELGDLQPGQFRELAPNEIQSLKAFAHRRDVSSTPPRRRSKPERHIEQKSPSEKFPLPRGGEGQGEGVQSIRIGSRRKVPSSPSGRGLGRGGQKSADRPLGPKRRRPVAKKRRAPHHG